MVLARLQQLEQLRLRGGRQLADLVEEQRAAFCRRDLADQLARRGRVRALLGAEQLALDETFRNRRAVDRDERLART